MEDAKLIEFRFKTLEEKQAAHDRELAQRDLAEKKLTQDLNVAHDRIRNLVTERDKLQSDQIKRDESHRHSIKTWSTIAAILATGILKLIELVVELIKHSLH